uniref:Uncharacterized protein n=1 Tax=Anguilla anguilla TaxID=7936 RepID=A0A0E9WVZ0_ANGAN
MKTIIPPAVLARCSQLWAFPAPPSLTNSSPPERGAELTFRGRNLFAPQRTLWEGRVKW